MTISVSVSGEKMFEWECTAEEAQQLDDQIAEMAGDASPEAVAQSVVMRVAERGGPITDDPIKARGEAMFLTWFLLSIPTNNPEHPGIFRDYIEAWNFDFDIWADVRDPRRFHVDVRGGFTGS